MCGIAGVLSLDGNPRRVATARLQAMGYTIHRPPRDGHMAFVRSPDLVSVELLQAGAALPPAEPWMSMPNVGSW